MSRTPPISLRDFNREIATLARPLFAQHGFRAWSEDIYLRSHGSYDDGFMFQRCRSGRGYWVHIGIHLPFMHDRHEFIVEANYPGLAISHRLGMFENGELKGSDKYYPFRNTRELKIYTEKMHDDFVRLALPWYERFRGLEDVANEYRKRRIDTTREEQRLHGPRPPDPFAWGTYGWIMEELGRREEAIPWWRKAYEHVRQLAPVAPEGGWVSHGDKRGGLVSRYGPAEQRLEELLRQSLGSPAPK